ncbi:MAG TPA: CoA transferase [Gaiellaceae bacterium]|nr:CoA transferase [Gaiellaceae bacterium]
MATDFHGSSQNGGNVDLGMYPNGGPLPLGDVRVLEMGQLLAGPFAGQLLGDYGCEVIKIEAPGAGDPLRQWGRHQPGDHSLWWPVVGRNKRSVAIDLRSQRGQGLVRKLVRKVDVIVENFRPGTLERWGLSFEELKAEKPDIILVRVTGYGQTGPYARRPGYGSIGEAMGGLRYLTGDPSTPPTRVGVSIGDALAGMFAAIGALVALHERTRTGRGQVVDVALYEAVLALMESLIPEYALRGTIRERSGAVLPNVAPSNVYPTADGVPLIIAANQDTVFPRLAEAMGAPELAADERFSTHAARGRHQATLDDMIAAWTSALAAEELERLLEQHEVPCGRIFRAPEMLADPHFAAREAIVRLPHPELGAFPMQSVVPKFSEHRLRPRDLGPDLGEHTYDVLSALTDLAPNEFEELVSSGVLAGPLPTPEGAAS